MRLTAPGAESRTAAVRRLARACLAVLVATVVAACASSTRTQVTPPAGFFGVSGYLPSAEVLRHLAASGASEFRTDASWSAAEPIGPLNGVTRYDWTSFDQTATTLAQAGIRWYPTLDYTPSWASRDGSAFGEPNDPAQFAAYAAAFATRYGAGGSFWSANPHLRYLPVEEYEIWNEENNPQFWDDQSNAPAAYATLLLAAERAIHAVQPRESVVLGGLLDATPNALAFLESMERADPGILATVDAVGYHPYLESLSATLARVVALRALLRHDGAANVPIEITETDGNSAFLGAATWKADLKALESELAGSQCDVTHFFPYTGSSATAGEGDADSSDWFVLFDASGSPSDIGKVYLAETRAIATQGAAPNMLCAASAGAPAASKTAVTTTGS